MKLLIVLISEISFGEMIWWMCLVNVFDLWILFDIINEYVWWDDLMNVFMNMFWWVHFVRCILMIVINEACFDEYVYFTINDYLVNVCLVNVFSEICFDEICLVRYNWMMMKIVY